MGRKRDGGLGSRTSHVEGEVVGAVPAPVGVVGGGSGGGRIAVRESRHGHGEGIEFPQWRVEAGVDYGEELKKLAGDATLEMLGSIKCQRAARRGICSVSDGIEELPEWVRKAGYCYVRWVLGGRRYRDLPETFRFALRWLRGEYPGLDAVSKLAEKEREEMRTRGVLETLEKYSEDDAAEVRGASVRAGEALLRHMEFTGEGAESGRGGGVTVNIGQMLMVNGDEGVGEVAKGIRRVVGDGVAKGLR